MDSSLRPSRIGLTGGIGSGKSTVLRMLQNLGAAAIDADAISHQVTGAGGAAIELIAAQFGNRFITTEGALDRDRMRAHAYADPPARHRLESIIHPLVAAQIALQTEAALAAGKTCIVIDIPLLVESNRWRQRLDRILVVDCSVETQIARVTQRNRLAPDEIRTIIAAQAQRPLRLACADTVICNEALPLEALQRHVAEVAQRFGL